MSDGVNFDDDDLLHDFFDGKSDGPAVDKTRKIKYDDVDDDDGDDDCIVID